MNTDISANNDRDFEAFDGSLYDSLYGKIQARAIHRHRQTPEELRPRISESVAEQGYVLAQDQILSALKNLAQYGPNKILDRALRNAAQLLEKLYWHEPPDSPERTRELEIAALAYYLAGFYARAYVLMQGVYNPTHSSNSLMKSMFLRELPKIRELALKTLSQEQFEETFLA